MTYDLMPFRQPLNGTSAITPLFATDKTVTTATMMTRESQQREQLAKYLRWRFQVNLIGAYSL
jgi:hypothetical protein